jgi:hypothetical protein
MKVHHVSWPIAQDPLQVMLRGPRPNALPRRGQTVYPGDASIILDIFANLMPVLA